MKATVVSLELTYLENEDIERVIAVEATILRGEPARLYGLPENCSPGSDDEVETVSIALMYPSGHGIERNMTDADAARLMGIDEATLANYIRDAALTAAKDDKGADGDRAYDAWKDARREEDRQ